MPRNITVTFADGSTHVYQNAPDNVTPEQVSARAASEFGKGVTSLDGGRSAAKATPAAPPLTKGDRFAKGLRHPIDGGAQLLTQMLPAGVVQTGNRLNNWLSDKTGLVGRLPEGGVDQQVREGEAAYQAGLKAAGHEGVDWMRMGGNAATTLPLAMTGAGAATLGARVATGAATGAAMGGLNPVTEGDFWTEKGKQAAAGGIGGAVAAPVAHGVARLVSPKASTSPAVQALKGEKVRTTVGQTLGGAANRVEEKAMSLPIVGDAIGRARARGVEDLNRAAFNRALAPIGEKLPEGVAGREAVEFVGDRLSEGYQRLLPSLTVKTDQQFMQQIGNLRQMVNTGSIDPAAAKAFNRILQGDVMGKLRGQNALTGQTLKAVEGDLSTHIRRLAGAQDADQQLVGNALQEVQSALRSMLERANPAKAAELKALNTGWANFKRVERAASMVGAEDGAFSAAQLQSAVKALDRSKDKGAFARGNALMQDLSDPAKNLMGGKVPNSGTADRLLLGGAPIAAMFEPTAALGMATVPLMYSTPGQALLRGLVSSRPQAAQPVANALRQAAPGLVPLGSQLGLNALNQNR